MRVFAQSHLPSPIESAQSPRWIAREDRTDAPCGSNPLDLAEIRKRHVSRLKHAAGMVERNLACRSARARCRATGFIHRVGGAVAWGACGGSHLPSQALSGACSRLARDSGLNTCAESEANYQPRNVHTPKILALETFTQMSRDMISGGRSLIFRTMIGVLLGVHWRHLNAVPATSNAEVLKYCPCKMRILRRCWNRVSARRTFSGDRNGIVL